MPPKSVLSVAVASPEAERNGSGKVGGSQAGQRHGGVALIRHLALMPSTSQEDDSGASACPD
jgi:hypothetical protein